MTKELMENDLSIFEQIRRIDNDGNEYWSVRDLAKALEYSEYRHFLPVVERAKEACQNSGHLVSDHFEHILEMVTIGSSAQREVDSVKLSRYACDDTSKEYSPPPRREFIERHAKYANIDA